MNKTEQLSQALIQISDKLGYTTQQVFEIYTQAQTAKAVMGSVELGIAAMFGLVFGGLTYRSLKDVEELDLDDVVLVTLMAAVLAGAIGSLAGGSVHDIGMRLLAPEYMAVKEMATAIGSMG